MKVIESIEQRAKTAETILLIVDSFIAGQGITCSETIYQTDRVIENAYEFIERLCDAAGYAELQE